MRFTANDFPAKQSSSHNGELSDSVAEEHPKHLVAVAEEQIKAMHSHEDGSPVELHQVGSREFIAQSISSSLEGKLSGSFGNDSEKNKQQLPQQNAAKIEYEKKSSQNQPTQLYGSQQSVTGGVSHRQETAMVGCNCGAEWTVTGQSLKAQGAEGVKVEQYGSAAGKNGGYSVSGGSGPGEYHAGGGQQGYKG